MLNMFSVFDPQTYYFLSLNWVSVVIILFLPQIYWMYSSRLFYFLGYFIFLLWWEFKIIMVYKFNVNNLIYFISLFLFIMMNNFMGLFPYIFTGSGHLIFSMIFSLSVWGGLMIFGWVENFNFMMIHLVPKSTPFFLMFFMVLIEFLSNLIRPMTLCIRLTANMIAGHLLMILLAQFICGGILGYMFMLMIQIILFLLEIGVSFIQAYVFVILVILYLKETN
uniref:ATP synthase subunit a n=1 Tax=Euurobracon breviterebrae TaxID=1421601 RepID=A0A0A6ZKQ3_9HYME|nr:ATP synthase F0 subunit 6 [Euurobracon breviterebrae]